MIFALTEQQEAQFRIWNRRHKCLYSRKEKKEQSEMYGRLLWHFRRIDKNEYFVEVECLCGEKHALVTNGGVNGER